MRKLSVIYILCLLVLCSCGKEEEEHQPDSDGYFLLRILDIESLDTSSVGKLFRKWYNGFEATLVEMPFTGTPGYFILRDVEGNDYRFEPIANMSWAEQLDGLHLGKTYSFALSVDYYLDIAGMKILDGGSLIYLAMSYSSHSSFSDHDVFLTQLEGFEAEQLHESEYNPTVKKTGSGDISLVTILPMVFRYGDQSVTLYQSQEAIFAIPQGRFLVHLLRSKLVDPQNYYDGGYYYSFYIKRL